MLLLLLLLMLLLLQLTTNKPKKRKQQQEATRIGCSAGGDGDVDNVVAAAGTADTMAASCHHPAGVVAFDASGSGTVSGDHHCRFGPEDLCHLLPRTVLRSRLWPPHTESSVDGGVVVGKDGFVDCVAVVAVVEVDGTPRGTERWPPPRTERQTPDSRTPLNRPTRTLPKTRSIDAAGDDRNGIDGAVCFCRHLLPQLQECHRQVAVAWCLVSKPGRPSRRHPRRSNRETRNSPGMKTSS